MPVETPTRDFSGGHWRGDNLFGESPVCRDARTGRRVWHFQLVHHGVWDWDPPTAATLLDITVDGRTIRAVAQITKQAWVDVLDRVTGKPVWPIEERPVPQSDVLGERTSATQPFLTKPARFDRQGFTLDDLIDFTPELKAEALEIASHYRLGRCSHRPRWPARAANWRPSRCHRPPAGRTGREARPIPRPVCSTSVT